MEKFRDMTVADFYNQFETKEKSESKYAHACEDLAKFNLVLQTKNSSNRFAMRYLIDESRYHFCLTIKSTIFNTEYILFIEEYIWEFISTLRLVKETLSIFELD